MCLLILLLERAGMDHRLRRRVVGQFGGRTIHVLRRVQLADERNRPAGYQRQVDLGPILAGGVIHDRPAFQHGRLVAEYQAVTGFPDRRGNHVAGGDVALPGVGGIDIDAALLLRARGYQRRQVVLELLLQFRIGKAQAGGRAQVDGAELAGIQHEIELIVLRLFVGAREGAGADDGAGNGFGAELQFDPRALDLVQQPGHAAACDLEGELVQLVAQRVHRIVTQSANLAAAAGADGERFQNVVHLRCVEIQTRRLARPESAGTLEKADAVFIKHHLLNGKIGGQRHGDAKDQADRNGKFHSFSNGGMPWNALSFRGVRQPPIAFIMTPFGHSGGPNKRSTVCCPDISDRIA